MKKPRLETVIEHYRVTRWDNFAASQPLEGIKTPATVDNDQSPLPSKEARRKKYLALSAQDERQVGSRC
ncbi:YhfG family protein [Xanthomonas oryzae pv. oryzicola]|uniref:YhfG family protein n=1 Tax=Xanthomonas oryzae TaxID=347 RepID=UPI0009E96902|nr:YhfG family protein [Xanthomonas oryzae]OWB15746.1 DUF2559 domain-containing protein [Xanthomonas oryzae pv. oryzicola]OWB26523.1 DUF2559 domain-containing protein [Xanthomonas oryzae pv. oryzicola]OWB31315.1 DUF2559 domain-containing protein [Xanthomonas oryzae pv. oryzicola]